MGYKAERDFSINKRLREILESEDKRTPRLRIKQEYGEIHFLGFSNVNAHCLQTK